MTWRRLWLATSGLVVLCAMTAGVVWFLHRQPIGLDAHYYRGIQASSVYPVTLTTPILTALDARPDTAAFKRHAAVPAEEFTAVWDGFLLTPTSRPYRFELESDDGARLYLGGTLVIDDWGQHAVRTTSAVRALSAGHHRIRIEYQQFLGEARLQLRWDGERESVMHPLSPYDVSPRQPSFAYVRKLRPVVVHSVPVLAAMWSAFMVAVLFLPAIMWLTKQIQADDRSRYVLAGVVGVTLFANAIGSWWGLPAWGWLAWAPDEVFPRQVIEGISQRFGHGWQTPYPAGHYYLLTWLFAPVLSAVKLGLMEPAIPHTATYMGLFVIARLATVLMAAMTLVVVYLVGQEVYGPRAGAFAALITAFTIPFGFYSKVANLDVPYLFWFALSFYFYANVVKGNRPGDLYGYAVAATLAICTKDQAYGLYLLPTLHIALLAWRTAGAGDSSRPAAILRRVSGPALAAIAVFAVVNNFAFNFNGFIGHVQILTGGQSGNFRMFSSDFDGQRQLLADALPQFRWMFGWTGLALVALGFWRTWKLGPSRRHPWVLLPAISYYLTFIAVIGYHYDRFWLPVALTLALMAGVALEWLFTSKARQPFGRLVAVAALVILVWRGSSVDALMLIDSRYDAERWLREHIPSGSTAVYVGALSYLPRVDQLDIHPMAATITETLSTRPQFVVVNPEFMRRYEAQRPEAEWWQWFSSEHSPYRIVYRKKARPRWLALSYEPRLYNGVHDRYSNLGKINPDIVVFERRASFEPDTSR